MRNKMVFFVVARLVNRKRILRDCVYEDVSMRTFAIVSCRSVAWLGFVTISTRNRLGRCFGFNQYLWWKSSICIVCIEKQDE